MDTGDLQILIVFNLDEHLTRGETQDFIALQDTATTAAHLSSTLQALGYRTALLPACDSLADFDRSLRAFSPTNTFIFNNADGFDGYSLGSARVAEVIETAGFKHTGAAAGTIATCTDKSVAKERLLQARLPTPAYQVFDRPEGEVQLRFPVIVKPLAEDGSLGIDLGCIVTHAEALFKRVDYVLKTYHEPVIAEEYIQGRELAISMWGNERIDCLPVTEEDYSLIPNPLECILTYESKWVPESFHYQNIKLHCPAVLPEEMTACTLEAAMSCYRVMGLRDFGRVDIRFAQETPYIIDINELPDLAPDGGFARAAGAAGYPFPQVIERILGLALRREGWL